MASRRRRRIHVWLVVVQFLLAISAPLAMSGDEITPNASNNNGNQAEAEALLKFKESLQNSSQLDNWNKSIEMCNGNLPNWKGLVCLNGDLIMLQLEGMGLSGEIDVDSLSKLPNLRQFSVANNNFTGSVPDLSKIGGGLRAVYLTNNRFSGEISDGVFVGLNSIRRVILASNQLSGRIPTSIGKLPKLVDLQLQNNEFEGEIPDLPQVNLTVNFANNKLEGSIPPHLSTQSSASFAGNNLCGPPLEPCKSSKNKIKIIAIILGVAGGFTLLLLLFLTYCFIRRRSSKKQSKYEKSTVPNLHKLPNRNMSPPPPPAKSCAGDTIKYKKINKSGSNASKLHFVTNNNNRDRFELEDLLRASAEILGSGSFGSSYKAELHNGSSMAVKRFKKMNNNNLSKEEFFNHMKKLGKLSHPNILPLIAFYYTKEEKLLVYDFVEFGSLASHLHGKKNPKNQEFVLDWGIRLKIIKGIAKGLNYLYREFDSVSLPHGHLKSSNVLLNKKFEPILCDYGLVPVMNREHAEQFMVAYKSPEHTLVNRKTDVWSLGILILELITGKFPANYLKQGRNDDGDKGTDLAGWVNSVVREEWTGEVFDKEMVMNKKRNKNGGEEGEMLKLLRIGMCCCERKVEKRWDLKEAIEKIEELKENGDGDEEQGMEEYYSGDGNSEEMYSSKAISDDDDFTFSVAEK